MESPAFAESLASAAPPVLPLPLSLLPSSSSLGVALGVRNCLVVARRGEGSPRMGRVGDTFVDVAAAADDDDDGIKAAVAGAAHAL